MIMSVTGEDIKNIPFQSPPPLIDIFRSDKKKKKLFVTLFKSLLIVLVKQPLPFGYLDFISPTS